MKLVAGLIALGVMTAFCGGCDNSRERGFFKNEFQHSGDGDYIPDDTLSVTDTVAYGEEEPVTLENNINVFSRSTNKLTISDNGVIFPGTTSDYTYPSDRFDDTTHPYIAPFWLLEDTPNSCKYQKTIKHLKLSDMVENGLDKGPSHCDLERIENIVNDCDDSYPRYSDRGRVVIDEAVIVTWKIECTISSTATDYYFQTVVATGLDKNNSDTRETFVAFLYEDVIPTGFDTSKIKDPFINGDYNPVAQLEYAAPCVPSGGFDKLYNYTNCRCNSWLTGIYVFATRDNNPTNVWDENTCSLDSTDFVAKCGEPDVDTRQTYQMNCRPSRIPQDTCTEDLYCALVQSPSEPWTYTFMVKDVGNWTSFVFLDADTLAETIDGDSSCRGDFDVNDGHGYYTGQISDTTQACGRKVTTVGADTFYKFAIRTYVPNYLHVVYGRSLILVGTCVPGDLPHSVAVGVTVSGVLTETRPPITGEKLKAMFLKERRWEDNNDLTAYDNATEVRMGTDLYLAIGYDYGSETPRKDGVVPYGFHVTDCWVSNNADFDNSYPNEVEKIVEDGCNTQAVDEPFYIQDEFVAMFEDDDAAADSFNFVAISGRMNAARFRTGSPFLFYKCVLEKFCRNYDFFLNSCCKKSCTNKDVDYSTTRRKRSDDENDWLESVEVQASIRIVPGEDEESSGQIECVTSTVAISTLVALLVLLIMAVLVTLMLFMKLQRRQKK